MKQSVLSVGAQLPQFPELWTLFASVSLEHHSTREVPAKVQEEYVIPAVSTNGNIHFLLNCPSPSESAHLRIPRIINQLKVLEYITTLTLGTLDWAYMDIIWKAQDQILNST